MMQFSERGNGKFLLTGEYLVLNGAISLALPLRYGQNFDVLPNESPYLEWEAYENEACWFSASIDPATFAIKKTSDRKSAKMLATLLKNAARLIEYYHPEHLQNTKICTQTDFPRKWGLGTSSTLVYCLSKWLNVNPYKLLNNTFGGSGYDIACADARDAIYFQKTKNINSPKVQTIALSNVWNNHCAFVYSGKKAQSRKAIRKYKALPQPDKATINQISCLAKDIAECQDLETLQNYLCEHEYRLGEILQMQPTQKQYFNDFEGQIKSLGAWGGDFLLAASEDIDYTAKYFTKKNLRTIIPYKQIVIEPEAEKTGVFLS